MLLKSCFQTEKSRVAFPQRTRSNVLHFFFFQLLFSHRSFFKFKLRSYHSTQRLICKLQRWKSEYFSWCHFFVFTSIFNTRKSTLLAFNKISFLFAKQNKQTLTFLLNILFSSSEKRTFFFRINWFGPSLSLSQRQGKMILLIFAFRWVLC